MQTRRPRISHIEGGDVLAELSRLLLFQADQLAATASQSIAEAFIGFELGHDGQAFADLPTSRVDLRRFPISRAFDRAASFVTRPRPDHVMGEEVHSLKTFMFHMPRSGQHSAASRKQQPFMHTRGLCRTVADAAIARWKLEVDRRGDFSLRELALLADVADTVALESLDRWRRVQHPRASFPSYATLQIADAVCWLSGQRGFRSSWALSTDDPHVRDGLAAVTSTEDLRDFVRAHREYAAPLLALAAGEGPSAELDMWERGGFTYEPARAAAFARSLGLDVPLFVAKVLELELRGTSRSTVAPRVLITAITRQRSAHSSHAAVAHVTTPTLYAR